MAFLLSTEEFKIEYGGDSALSNSYLVPTKKTIFNKISTLIVIVLTQGKNQ
jgi:hypothetical protein